MNKILVYTCINREVIGYKENHVKTDGIDYICFTDDPSGIKSDVFKGMRSRVDIVEDIDESIKDIKNITNRYWVRDYLISQKYRLAHKSIPEIQGYDITIWMDGSFNLVGKLDSLIDIVKKRDEYLFLYKHPTRDCIYEEIAYWKSIKKGFPPYIKKTYHRYLDCNFPRHYGLWAGGIQIRKHPQANNYLDLMWKDILKVTSVGQLGMPYIFKTNNIPYYELGTLSDPEFKKIFNQRGYPNKKYWIGYDNEMEESVNGNNYKYQYKLSFIIPTFNSGGLLRRAVESCMKSCTKGNYEIIVIDD